MPRDGRHGRHGDTTAAAGGHEMVLSLEDLSISYPGRDNVLRGVTLHVAESERVGVVGPNGAGKTTLFLAVCGVVAATAGSIRLFGELVRARRFRPEVGMVFQSPDHQLICPTVADDLAFGPRNLGLEPAEVEARVAEAAAATGVERLLGCVPHHLSGGEKRMVSIAGVLAMRPRLIVYDEPSANLDIRSRRRLIGFLNASAQTQLVASHDLELILEVCPRTVLIDEGRLVADGPSAELMNDTELMLRHGLERPHSLVPHAEPHHHHG